MTTQERLSALCSLNGPSGFEQPVSQLAAQLMEQVGMNEITVDKMGNVLGVRRCGSPTAKKLLLDAHLDEIGLMVTGIEDGYLRFRSIGGVDPRMLPARELTILTTPPIFGVVACLPPHVQNEEDYDKSVPIAELFIDIGMTHEQAEKAVPIGTPITYRGGCFPLGGNQMCGKAMDDRACFATLLRAAELLREQTLDVDLYLLGSSREEISGAGAVVSTNRVAPDFCVAVDVTHGKTPDFPATKGRVSELGGGPAIGIGPNMTTWMTRRMKAKAEENHIPWQAEVMAGHTGTNGWHMQIAQEGIATSVISLPLKYMHTPIEVLALEDVEAVAKLLAAFTVGLGEEAETIC